MQTVKEAFLAVLKGEEADFIPEFWSSHYNIPFMGDRYESPNGYDAYGTGPDAWGVMWTNMDQIH